MIRNKAVVNEDTSGTVQQLQSEIRRLKQLVEKLRSESLYCLHIAAVLYFILETFSACFHNYILSISLCGTLL